MKRKFEDFGELWPAEEKILAEIDSGEPIVLHNGLPPDVPGDYDVRAEFIRYLVLGGCDACGLHEKGLRIVGARIIGVLDVEGGDLPRDLALFACRFESELIFRSTKLQNLFLNGSLLPHGLNADGLEAKGSVFLQAVEAFGEVRLLGAKLGGNLTCVGAKFNAAKDKDGRQTGYAFAADRLEARGDFSLIRVEADGGVNLNGAKVGGYLSCVHSKITVIEGGGHFGIAFFANELRVEGRVDFDSMDVIGKTRMIGALAGGVPIDYSSQLKWLAECHRLEGFRPQPYEQLANSLRKSGHRENARDVMIEKERLQRAAGNPPWWQEGGDWIMRVSAGYGYHPMLSVRWLAGLMLVGMLVFGGADLLGAVKPNSARVWHLPEWEKCVDNQNSPKWCYLASEKGQSYPAFNPFIYSVDTLLPIVDLEMQGAWIPDARASWWGIGARVYLWLHIALGWFFSLLAVAGFSGLIKPE